MRARNYIQAGCGGERGGCAADTVGASAVTGAAASRLAAELAEVASRRSTDGARAARTRNLNRATAHRRKIILNFQPVFHLT